MVPKVIVVYQCFPGEYRDYLDSRPKSIERITMSVADLKSWLISMHIKELKREWFKFSNSIYSLYPEHPFYDSELDTNNIIQDGFEYLYQKLCNNELTICFCRIGEFLYGIQIRNLYK